MGTLEADLTGWVLSDLTGVRHSFTELTLAPGEVLVLFDRGEHSDVPGAVLSSSTQLGLNNGGDALILEDGAGRLQDEVTWSGSTSGLALNRSPDGQAGGALLPHDEVSPEGLRSSPGLRADGSPW